MAFFQPPQKGGGELSTTYTTVTVPTVPSPPVFPTGQQILTWFQKGSFCRHEIQEHLLCYL